MFDSEIKVKINYDARPESNDPENLATAIFVLQDVRAAFEKAGTCCETECGILEDAERILSEISRNEVF